MEHERSIRTEPTAYYTVDDFSALGPERGKKGNDLPVITKCTAARQLDLFKHALVRDVAVKATFFIVGERLTAHVDACGPIAGSES